MTESSMTLAEYLRKIDVDLDGDFLREGVRLLAQLVMEGEITEQVGAAKYQRTPERKTQRNGYRERPWDTRVGSIELAIPGCAKAATSRASLSHAGASRKRCWRWCSKRTSRA